MRPWYAGQLALAVALVAACSGEEPAARRSSTTPTPSLTEPTPAVTADPSPTTASATPTALRSPSAAPSPTRSPAARLTRSPSPSPKASPTRNPSPTRAGTTKLVSAGPGFLFDPDQLTLRVGDSVLVTSRDPALPHNFTISALGARSGTMDEGDRYRYRFTRAGTFTFVCTFHDEQGMDGTVTVSS